jgi:23S rRNA pseudouridine1911/1915/1917 synthase
VITLILTYTVNEENINKTVKHILKSELGLSERLIKKLKMSGNILCNSLPIRVNELACYGDTISAVLDFEEDSGDVLPEKIDIDIIYEDNSLVVLNKQPNIVVHPTFNHPSGTVANAVMYHLNAHGEKRKIRPVSRLDRNTSGIIIFAKNAFVQDFLIRQMGNTFKKEYMGIVHGTVISDKGTINLPISRKPDSIMLRHVSETGSPSITHYEVLERLNNATLLKFTLETGRTHQIRVHCQAINHPLVGDTLYCREDALPEIFPSDVIDRQALHSYKARFVHPLTKTSIELSAPLPEDILKALEILRNI